MLVRKSAEDGGRTGVEKGVIAGLPPEEDAVANRALAGVRLSFRLPESLHRRLKLHAVRNGTTLVGTITGWVREMTPAA